MEGQVLEKILSEEHLEAVFGRAGPLAARVPEYRVRTQQLQMAARVAEAMRDNAVLVCEAGTGTGKTFAYLVPALLSAGKVIVSTGTKTLQDQLYRRDLPTVRSALGVSVTTALLKGRANYVCHYHLERALEGQHAREVKADLRRIAGFARVTHSGDKSECADVPEEARAWDLATSTRENCLGQSCPRYRDCFVMAARREAQAADLVVVNHHLFFADVMLKDEGMAELLPACNTVILDEAHQLPDIATRFFGETLSTAQLLELSRDVRAETLAAAGDMPEARQLAAALEKAARDLRLALPQDGVRATAASLARERAFSDALEALGSALASLAGSLGDLAERSEGLARCSARAREAQALLERWRDEERADLVRWIEVLGHSLRLNATPLSVAEIFRRQLEGRPRAWIFTSATLAVAGDFSHFSKEMGLHGARTACWGSPFDYASQAMLCVPKGLPDPNSEEHTRAVVAASLPVIHASRGRAFLLFTTLRAMRLAHRLLREEFDRAGLSYPLMLQGQGSRSELLERFRALGNAVLVGSASFWEGVDVRGEALSLVIIDKLPFAPPDDPVLAARLDALERAGDNPFLDYQVPQAVIALKQGAGRLIRDETDRGVLMICDPRLFAKPYGRRILSSLPPMKLVRDLDQAVRFFERDPGVPDASAISDRAG
ncbi:MAG TPA: ATP-dependent DNA helicase [Burkholderiales bacterium]|nr:ATP-dependent DNA helicase [Burkholderiales bacterium]